MFALPAVRIIPYGNLEKLEPSYLALELYLTKLFLSSGSKS